jgi:hypothetical protein
MVTPKGNMSTEGETPKFLSYYTGAWYVHPWWLLRAPDKHFSHTLTSLSGWPQPACSFHSAQAATVLEFLVPLTNCFVHKWFCVVHGTKSLLYYHNWLNFGKFQDTECFLIPYPHHVSSWLPLAVKQKKLWRDFLPIDMLLSAVSVLVVVQPSSEVPEGLTNYPVYMYIRVWMYVSMHAYTVKPWYISTVWSLQFVMAYWRWCNLKYCIIGNVFSETFMGITWRWCYIGIWLCILTSRVQW